MCIHYNNTNCFMNIQDKLQKQNDCERVRVCACLFLVFIFTKSVYVRMAFSVVKSGRLYFIMLTLLLIFCINKKTKDCES